MCQIHDRLVSSIGDIFHALSKSVGPFSLYRESGLHVQNSASSFPGLCRKSSTVNEMLAPVLTLVLILLLAPSCVHTSMSGTLSSD